MYNWGIKSPESNSLHLPRFQSWKLWFPFFSLDESGGKRADDYVFVTFIYVFQWSRNYVNFHQDRGLDDRKLLPYFPFRDDGIRILTVIEDMVEDYVNL